VKLRFKKFAFIALSGLLILLTWANPARPVQAASTLQWEYQLDFIAPSADVASQQAYSVTPGLRRENYRLYMNGSQGLDQLRQTLFSPQLAGFLGGPAEIRLTLPVSGSNDLNLQLEANLSTGYRWEVQAAGSAGFTQLSPADFTTRTRGYGAPGVQGVMLRSRGEGTAMLTLAYRRPFGPAETVSRRVTITASEPLDQLDLTNPHPQIFGPKLAVSDELPSPDPFALLPVSASAGAASLDWRLAGIVPPIRDQGGCGSCWAFGTVGIMESAIAKISSPIVDLSEQFLVSCNTSGWNCADGGLTAHRWHYDTLAMNQTSIGAVLEADKPYTATDGSCAAAYNHPYTLSGWQFVGSDEWSMPSVAQIKNAISLYGPVTAGVCAGPAFSGYSGGIFKTDEYCGRGLTNHQIILVGWQDTSASQGYWILRNSWGTWWGEGGYMRIAYGTSRVGEGTSWVMYGRRYYFPWIGR
jgi:inhibitor of cysteine peptidase